MTLHREAVTPELLLLLLELMTEERLSQFALGGGTSLALRFGHRESVDIDLFTTSSFEAREVADMLKRSYGLREAETAVNSVSGVINDIKVDILSHRYPLLLPIVEESGIRMLSLEDMAAMKLNAVANRGSKKDFWDVAELFSEFTCEEMLSFFSGKYPGDSVWNVGKSLSYFEDAEVQPDPRSL
ncbi:MAG TPA: nucleotidyl transferase AbiEii/AbiGii toxin family protein [Verrucomicrobiales bacterium]|nr:nucleotidyl transferase AbiEii/AbiGii toxin family protein [Verrucomicrobiales bacterium]